MYLSGRSRSTYVALTLRLGSLMSRCSTGV
jgi:hypothetical protein